MKRIFPPAAVVLLALSFTTPGKAATITAGSCADTDVQMAVDAASHGDTVVVPSGSCAWQTGVKINNKGLVLQGAGIDETIITDQTGSTYGQEPLWIVATSPTFIRVTGFTFSGMKKRSSTEPAIWIATDASSRWRIDHTRFDATGTYGRGIVAKGYGVVDHSTFVNTTQGVAVFGFGNASWSEPLSLGTDKAVYVEDSLFDYEQPLDGALDAYDGARYVFRHNTVRNTSVGHHGLDSGGYRSTHSYEIYSNHFEATAVTFTVAHSRGGTGVVHSNTVLGAYGNFCTVVNYRTCLTNLSWGRCDGFNSLDGNLPGMMGYPCRDQVGRSTDQTLEPVYSWGNSFNTTQGSIVVHDPWNCVAPSMADHIKEDRDYFNQTPRPGYQAYTYPHPLTTQTGAPPAPSQLLVQ